MATITDNRSERKMNGAERRSLKRLVSVFFERLPNHIVPRWYHAHAYYDFRRNECVNVIYPLNFAFQAAWWVNMRWCRHTKHPSWIDRQVKAKLLQSR